MKKIVWNERKYFFGASNDIAPLNGKKYSIGDKIEKGMKVCAKYGGSDVHMEIIDDTNTDCLQAVIKFFEPINDDHPNDLSIGDIVSIDKKHICWVFA